LLEDFDDVLRVDAHGTAFTEEKNHAEILWGAELSRFGKKVLRPIREPNAKRPKGLTFDKVLYFARLHRPIAYAQGRPDYNRAE
jgi:hypothetical protein